MCVCASVVRRLVVVNVGARVVGEQLVSLVNVVDNKHKQQPTCQQDAFHLSPVHLLVLSVDVCVCVCVGECYKSNQWSSIRNGLLAAILQHHIYEEDIA